MSLSQASLLLPKNALEVIQGESKTIRLSVTQPDPTGVKKRIPFPLTGGVVYMTIKKALEDREPLIQKVSTEPTQAQITNDLGGVAEFYLTPADTHTMDLGDYFFDIWVKFTSGPYNGKRYPVVRPSTFRLVPGVTRLSF